MKPKTYPCIGHEGYECGKPVKRSHAPRRGAVRCPECLVAYRAEYQHLWYGINRDKALDYQKAYGVANRKKQRLNREAKAREREYMKGGLPKEDREEIRSVHNPVSLARLSPEKFERYFNRILAGKVDYVEIGRAHV